MDQARHSREFRLRPRKLYVCRSLAVSGAHNTIVTARAGKDLVSSLTSGLLTIVSRPPLY